jgi:hypothetical protein
VDDRVHHPVDESNNHSLVNEPTQSPPKLREVRARFWAGCDIRLG